MVAGTLADKAARLVGPVERLELAGPPARFVGRGGDKLDAALDRFGVLVAGRRALDAGSSTGGFTDCLLQRGASQVTAVDVGYGQLDLGVRQDPRVRVLERTNVRDLTIEDLGVEPLPLVVADLSFISLRTVAPALLGLVAEGGDLVLLVKPQFEAGRAEARRTRGIIRDPEVWCRVLEQVGDTYNQGGAVLRGLMASPLLGAEGNAEFLAHFVAGNAAAADPAAFGTAASRPEAATAAAADAVAADPAAADAPVADAPAADPATADPATADPATADPAAARRVAVDVAVAEAVARVSVARGSGAVASSARVPRSG